MAVKKFPSAIKIRVGRLHARLAASKKETPLATSKVIGTPELLECILLQLELDGVYGMKTLLLSQRVCKSLKAIIQGSPKLQRALFFQPMDEARDDIWRLNPLLFASSSPLLKIDKSGSELGLLGRGFPGSTRSTIAHNTFPDTPPIFVAYAGELPMWRGQGCRHSRPWNPRSGSWQRMLVAQLGGQLRMQTALLFKCHRAFTPSDSRAEVMQYRAELRAGDHLVVALRTLWVDG